VCHPPKEISLRTLRFGEMGIQLVQVSGARKELPMEGVPRGNPPVFLLCSRA
jgi:hypothetical protein